MHTSSLAAGLIAAAGAALCVTGTSVHAQDYQARSWAASCAACHGTNGQGGFEVPIIAGRSKADLLLLLKEFKSDQRKTATIMHQHAKGYTDAQLERIADYFSRQSR